MKQNSLITLDWLSISIKLNVLFEKPTDNKPLELSDSTILNPTHRKTSNFGSIYQIIHDGMHIGDLQCDPNKGLMTVDHAIIKFANEILYTEHLSEIYYRIKKSIDFRFYKFNQIDIALDTPADKIDVSYIYQYARGEIDFIGNQEVTAIFKNSRSIKYFRIGSKMSDKFVRQYYKRKELEVSNKKYISDYWELNGFDPNIEVFRSEISMKGRLLKKMLVNSLDDHNDDYTAPFMEEDTINTIQDTNFLKSIYHSETEKFIKYCYTADLDTFKRTNRCKQYNPFSYLIKESRYLFKRIKDDASRVIHKVKMTAKFMHQIGIETGELFYKFISTELCNFEGLNEWKERRVDRWEREHRLKMRNPNYKKYIAEFVNRLDITNINFLNE